MNKKFAYTDRSDSLLDSYLRDISKYKILESSEINELIKKAQAGDNKAREKIVLSNLRFVVSVAKQFQGRGIPLMDLISSGSEGLMKAVDKFDIEKGVTFLSYAVYWIKQSIYNSIYWQAKEIRLPLSQQLIINNIADCIDKFLKEHHRNPSPIEISEITDIPVKQIDYLSQYSNKFVYIDDFIGGDEDNNQICDIIPDGESSLDEILNKDYISKGLEEMLDKLTIREHDLICMLYGIGVSSISSKEISDMFGVSVERIRQMKEATLTNIRKKFGTALKALL